MKLKKIFIIHILFLLTLIIGCQNSSTDKKFLILTDFNFCFKEVKNTSFMNKVKESTNQSLYFDTLNRIKPVILDSDEKFKLLAKDLVSEMQIDTGYFKKYITAYYISKLKLKFSYNGVLILIRGDDLDMVKLVILDEKENVISSKTVYGLFCPSPVVIENVFIDCPRIETSFFSDRIISKTVNREINTITHKDKKSIKIDTFYIGTNGYYIKK